MKYISKNVCSCLSLRVTALELSVQTRSDAVVVIFEGLQNNEQVPKFYNCGFYLDNITIGSATRILEPASVPESSSALGILALGSLGGGSWLKRQQKKQKSVNHSCSKKELV